MASFGNFIKSEREKRELTQTEFGALIGINSSAISRIENGTQKFSKSKLQKLAEIFVVELQEVTDLFYADKFAIEAYENHCSENIFVIAENNVKYIKSTNTIQAKLNF
ncbi:MAG TPA: helix-turn-helix transcriptional regulator [Flavobacterium sp.]|nr:helix-turn-helix transcriptional regulator [Flavobacterium sp.]